MANVLAELFANTASAIREKTGDSGTMKPAEFPEKIRGITTGGSEIPEGYLKPEGTLPITKNGTVDVSTYEKAEVNVPTGGDTETVLTALSVTENGTYAPTNAFNPWNGTYKFQASYTQELLSSLYAEASAVFEFPMNDFATGAFLVDNDDEEGNALAVVRFMLGETSFYGLMKECSEPKFWAPVEVATALGQSAEGWYSLVDESTMAFAPADVPEYSVSENATYTVDYYKLGPLFTYDEFNGYSSVKVDVQPKLAPLTATANGVYIVPDGIDGYNPITISVPTEGGGTLTPKIASGTFTPPSMTEGVTVEHNLGVMPDIVILRVRAYINADAIPSYAGHTTAVTGVCKEIGDLTGHYQYIQMFIDNKGQWLQAEGLAPMEENGYGAVIRNATTSTVTFGGNGVRLITDGNGVADDLYYWTVIGGIVQR